MKNHEQEIKKMLNQYAGQTFTKDLYNEIKRKLTNYLCLNYTFVDNLDVDVNEKEIKFNINGRIEIMDFPQS